jgi:hypothetical protein
MGEKTASTTALVNAISVFPTSYRGRWVSGNLLLQQGDFEKALSHFSYLLAHYPNQSATVYDALEKAVNDVDFVLERIVPKDPSSFRQYLAHVYGAGDREAVRKGLGEKAFLRLSGRSGGDDSIRRISHLPGRIERGIPDLEGQGSRGGFLPSLRE